MLSFAVVSLLAVLAVAADSAPNTLTDAEKAAGWKLLFDGKTTNGWRNYQKTDIGPGWKVENGKLSVTLDELKSYTVIVVNLKAK